MRPRELTATMHVSPYVRAPFLDHPGPTRSHSGLTPWAVFPSSSTVILAISLYRKRVEASRQSTIRNVLIGIGAFYVSRWMAGVLRVSVTALAHEVMAVDGFRQALLTPFVASLSHALAAASAGAAAVLFVDAPESSSRWRWAAIPAVLWFLRSLDEVTISAPGWMHLATQLVTASLPSIVCLAAGHLADWHRSR
jgi:hypothetical protein